MADEINERKMDILKAVISDYVSTGEPVGSRTLAKKYNLGISPATIRNEMADLEELGFLEQPHTSAGRVPSSMGYRVYVDQLMERGEATKEEIALIEQQIVSMATFQIDKIIKQTSQMLSELTNLAIIASKPSTLKCHLKTLQLVALGEKHLMVVLVLDNNQVKNTILDTSDMPRPEDLLMLSNLLTARLSGLTAQEIDISIMDTVRRDLKGYSGLFASVLSSIHDALCQDENGYIVEGKNNILDYPEFNDIVKAREILEVLEQPKDLMVSMEDSPDADKEFRIVIGDEINLPQKKDWSVISAKYKLNGQDVGTINLLGPKRLDYSKVSMILKNVVEELNRKLINMTKEGEEHGPGNQADDPEESTGRHPADG
ncbi:Heat-inducible transcription repressor HrcA [Clostridiaceae bacterium JG1575]|nr:Heat-inducible transcription repressor HrcA [Clostridiaceae bacterium JG1575]